MKKIAIIGSGPAALMCASQLTQVSKNFEITIFEKRKALGRKLLIAGSSGLNISNGLENDEFAQNYSGFDFQYWKKLLTEFSPQMWIQWIEKNLKLKTFLGTSNRYFVENVDGELKASDLLRRWIDFLTLKGVRFFTDHELTDFKLKAEQGFELSFNHKLDAHPSPFDHVILACGGAAWEKEIPSWFKLLESKKIICINFEASNVGYEVNWNREFLNEAESKPIKNCIVETQKGQKQGELMVTTYGLEGTPIYTVGCRGKIYIDLKPQLSHEECLHKMSQVRENYAPIRRIKKTLGLCDASLALLYHYSSAEEKEDAHSLVDRMKNIELELIKPRSLEEAISSRGGIDLKELTKDYEFKKIPGLYAIGEILDWDAPTGGFLIQACVSQGVQLANIIIQNNLES